MTTELASRADTGRSIQRRSYPLDDFEFRSDDGDDGERWTFEGVASVVGHPYLVRDMFGEFTETIRNGAFDRTLANRSNHIALHVNHQTKGFPFAARSKTASTLEVWTDPDLRVRATLDPRRPDVQSFRSVVERGEMREMSIGFRSVADGTEWSDDYTSCEVRDLVLRETSLVDQGCNDMTTGSMRSMVDELLQLFPEGAEVNETELRRAIARLEGLLPTPEPVVERSDGSGLVVTDELIDLFHRRHAA